MIDAEIVERLQEQQRSLRRQRWINSALIAGLAGIILLAASRPQSPVDESIRTSTVPIGAIVPFWGGPDDLITLEDYELCDGGQVLTEDSPIRGFAKPDLRNKFLAGADRASLNLWSDPVTGGIDTTPAVALGQTGGHSLTVAQMPKHKHDATVSTVKGTALANGGRLVIKYVRDSGKGTPSGTDGNPGNDANYEFDLRWPRAVTPADHTHVVTVLDSGNGAAHSHALPPIPAHDNRPPFVGVHFLIRVK